MDGKCFYCNNNNIESKSRPLCKNCYTDLHKKGLIDMYPIINSDIRTRENCQKKYGKGFLKYMELLKSGNFTLREIGERFNITRERVRQIYNKIYNEPYTIIVENRKIKNKEEFEKDRVFKLNIENQIKRYKKEGNRYKSIVSEYKFYKKCLELGYDVTMRSYGKHIYDSDVNGFKVEIKTSTHAKKHYSKAVQSYYHVQTHGKQKEVLDFLAVYIYDDGFWYILPKAALLKSNHFFIPKGECYGKGRFDELQKYREAWHLIESKKE